jgi:hypothetical protein
MLKSQTPQCALCMLHCNLFGFIFVAGFLGFREAPAIVEAVSRLRDTNINLVPECILVDGSGILLRGFGLAPYVGELKCCITNGDCRCLCLLHWQQYCRLAAVARLKVFTVMLLNIQSFLHVMLCCWQVVPGMSMACIVFICRVSFL